MVNSSVDEQALAANKRVVSNSNLTQRFGELLKISFIMFSIRCYTRSSSVWSCDRNAVAGAFDVVGGLIMKIISLHVQPASNPPRLLNAMLQKKIIDPSNIGVVFFFLKRWNVRTLPSQKSKSQQPSVAFLMFFMLLHLHWTLSPPPKPTPPFQSLYLYIYISI